MCKFTIPQVDSNATDDERRKAFFDAMYSADLSEEIEKKNGLSYISWSTAWKTFKEFYPGATYRIIKDENNLPYFTSKMGVFVNTEITADGLTYEMILPVLDGANRPQKEEAYQVSIWDNYKKTYVEKTVAACDSFSINRAVFRCLTKNMSMFGCALALYQGIDFPTDSNDEPMNQPKQVVAPQPKAPIDPLAPIKNAINSTQTSAELLELYFSHQSTVEGNPEIKALFSSRRAQLQHS